MELRIEAVRKDFDLFPALHGVSLDIRSGELIALLGPSGSGKTTLLRLIAGLETPTAGRVFFGNEDASLKPVQDRQVGFVFQHYALFKHMTVADNIGFGLRVRPKAGRPPAAEIRRRALDLLELVQLPGLADRYPAQLSGGQRQRVALARALAIEPRVLLLDEPFGALDAQVRKDLRRWLREIHDRTGHTTVFVTHDQEEALELADRVVVMAQGRIEQVGTPDEVYDRPATPFVHGFIGESAALPVAIERGEVWFAGRPTGHPVLPPPPGRAGRGRRPEPRRPRRRRPPPRRRQAARPRSRRRPPRRDRAARRPPRPRPPRPRLPPESLAPLRPARRRGRRAGRRARDGVRRRPAPRRLPTGIEGRPGPRPRRRACRGFFTCWRRVRIAPEASGAAGPGVMLRGAGREVVRILAARMFANRTLAGRVARKAPAMAEHDARRADRSRKRGVVVGAFEPKVNRRRTTVIKTGP
jgi:sulfate transport system ATP-binding protein